MSFLDGVLMQYLYEILVEILGSIQGPDEVQVVPALDLLVKLHIGQLTQQQLYILKEDSSKEVLLDNHHCSCSKISTYYYSTEILTVIYVTLLLVLVFLG